MQEAMKDLEYISSVTNKVKMLYADYLRADVATLLPIQRDTKELILLAEKAKKEIKQFSEENSEKIKEAVDRFPECDKKLYNRAVGLHRGYLCPCPIRDLVVGNVSRKHLIKKIRKKEKTDHYYEYNFDEQGNLSCVSVSGRQIEFIVRVNNVEKGFMFSANGKPAAYCESKYEHGHIVSFLLIELFSFNCSPLAIDLYEYSYEDGLLKQCKYTNLHNCSYSYISGTVFDFFYNEDCTYKEYTAESLYTIYDIAEQLGETIEKPKVENRKTIYPVTIKRLAFDFCKPFNYFEYMNPEQK